MVKKMLTKKERRMIKRIKGLPWVGCWRVARMMMAMRYSRRKPDRGDSRIQGPNEGVPNDQDINEIEEPEPKTAEPEMEMGASSIQGPNEGVNSDQDINGIEVPFERHTAGAGMELPAEPGTDQVMTEAMAREKKRTRRLALRWKKNEDKLKYYQDLGKPVPAKVLARSWDTRMKKVAEKYFSENPLQTLEAHSAELFYYQDNGGYYHIVYPAELNSEEVDRIHDDCKTEGLQCSSDFGVFSEWDPLGVAASRTGKRQRMGGFPNSP